MFHAFDSTPANRPITRPDWMALLSRAPLSMLEQALAAQLRTSPSWLRKPETGLYMVQGRAGGTGERFNLGEITVTRCALRLHHDSALVGVAYVMGRNHRQAQLAAMADALLQDPTHHHALDDALLQPIRQLLQQQQAQRNAQAQSTKVDFFTVARESGASSEESEE
jgi:alpha-D-ribose 1-methylphosphonate 5-triphosphate synthase subunit PhnG